MSRREEILRDADALVTGSRQAAYGPPSLAFGRIARYWSVYLDRTVSADDVAELMVLLKIARTQHGPYNLDSYVDQCGYAALAGELAGEDAGHDERDARDVEGLTAIRTTIRTTS